MKDDTTKLIELIDEIETIINKYHCIPKMGYYTALERLNDKDINLDNCDDMWVDKFLKFVEPWIE